ncbi:Thioesterase AMT4 [Cladobotryum mycophilum]|uniref:Thioesterase AMT4 n=1 Tax=Cladobotryum mycophilum TaxID=491253 RepID=A0ABR0SBR3_9HYPO
MSDNSLTVIQDCDSSVPLPLVLIHDGGGTVMHYYSLGDMGRTVYGIDTKSTWRDGIPSMVEDYCAMIKEMDLPAILLGGWSLGGIVALEIAQALSEDPDIDVVGVILIESIYPQLVKRHYANINPLDLTYSKNIPNDVRDRIYTNLSESIQAVQSHKMQSELNIPPTVLIRAVSSMPSLQGIPIPDVLGWDHDGHDFIKQVYKVPGHHFSIFQDEHV